MTVAAFASAADVLGMMRGYKLLDANQSKACGELLRKHPGATPDQLVEFAVERSLLTRFQAELVLGGNAHTLALPPFVLVDTAGRAEAGQIYRARGQDDQKTYVLKILARGNRAGTPRVTQSLRRFAAFRSPGVVPITHVGTVSERTYLVWPDPVDGQSLEQLVQAKGKLTPKQVVHYAIQAARALHACHDKELFHGLLKASDLWIDAAHKVTIKDLGMGFLLTLSREDAAMDTMTSLGQLASGLDWASPESLLDQRDRTPLSDQYSLGCILYYALTGQVPFPMTSKVRKMMAHQTEEPTPLRELAPEVPARLAAVVARLMKKAPAERFAGMAEVEEALQGLLARQDTPAHVAGDTRPVRKPVASDEATNLRPERAAARAASAPAPQAAEGEGNDNGAAWVMWGAPLLAGVAACLLGWLLLGG
jgi:serine/threonine-protein kinase